jgi:hypothetical protein
MELSTLTYPFNYTPQWKVFWTKFAILYYLLNLKDHVLHTNGKQLVMITVEQEYKIMMNA